MKTKYIFQPLTFDLWNDFEKLFGEKGACGGCWCMWWRLTKAEFEKNKGSANKRKMKSLVKSGEVPGLIAYYKNEPVGWCSFAPREKFTLLKNSRILKPVDDKPVWSVVCFYINKEHRNKGLSIELLKAVSKFVKKKGGNIIEGYPYEPKKEKMADVFAWVGLAAAFKKAGFKECARRSPTRPIMRLSK